MLEFVDRFSDQRFRSNPDLRCAAIWVGVMGDETALVDYLSPDDPASGCFAAHSGDTYDPDFLNAQHREYRPVSEILADVCDTYQLKHEEIKRLSQAATQRGVTGANAYIVLEQHAYYGNEGMDFHGLVFVGNVEYEQTKPPRQPYFTHLFAGIAKVPTLGDLRAYVWDGPLTEALGVELSEGAHFGYQLREGSALLTPRDFFDLPIARQRILLGDSFPTVERACRACGLDAINAFISGTHDGNTPLRVDPSDEFAGLHYLGVFETLREA